MSIAGVRSNRGDGYQTLVAFDWALNVLSDPDLQWLEIDSVTHEVDDVVVGKADGSLIACQCKKNQIDFKAWSISDLSDEIDKAASLLAKNLNVEVRFYSRTNFGALAKLREHCLTQQDDTSYQASLGKSQQETDAALLARLAIKAPNLSTYEFLRRTKFATSDELDRLASQLLERLRYMASNPNVAFNAIWVHLDQLGARMGSNNTATSTQHRLTKDDLKTVLHQSGAMLIPPMNLAEVRSSFISTSAVGRSWRRDIAGLRIASPVVNELLAAIDAKKRSILLTGLPGSGKTCVMLALQEELELRMQDRSDILPLFIQSREFADFSTSQERQAQGLSEQWVEKVARMADDVHVVVVIDSLDVLSIARDHSVLTYFLGQIDRLLLIPNITVVTACRDFDRHYDRRIAGRQWDCELKCKPLEWHAEVAPLLDTLGIATAVIDAVTRELIKNPRELALFVELAQRKGSFNVVTSQALAQRYLDTIVRANSALGDVAIQAIETIAAEMLKSRSLVIPYQRFTATQKIQRELCSLNVLQETGDGKLTFGHQTLLDVLVISGAVRSGITLNDFIQSLPPVPFVRPSIRSFVAQLALGERREFRKQLRAVLTGGAAFHIRRLVAESFAEQTPQDDDWPLIRDLRENHRDVFQVIYNLAKAIDWHHFWFKHLVPLLKATQDTEGLKGHIHRIAQWGNSDTAGVLSLWMEALSLDWLDGNMIADRLGIYLAEIKSENLLLVAPLLNRLLDMPRAEHSFLGRVIARCVEAGIVEDTVLWRYISDDISDDDLLQYRFDDKLHCHAHEFGDRNDNFVRQRMEQSTRLLDLALESIERWSNVHTSRYGETRIGYRSGFLRETSYELKHTQRAINHADSMELLFGAVEAAIVNHAKINSDWWKTNRERLGFHHEGALLYFTILACTAAPEANLSLIGRMLCDKSIVEFELNYELGSMIESAFHLLDSSMQDAVMANIMTAWEEDTAEVSNHFWILRTRAELIAAIPCYQRSPEAQRVVDAYQNKAGVLIRQPYIHSWGGIVRAPFSFEVFLGLSDSGVLSLLNHYNGYSEWSGSKADFLVGGEREVAGQLQEASSRHPTRFLSFLPNYWADIPEKFRDNIMDGVSTYLTYRHGNTQAHQAWIPVEEPDGIILASHVLDELERHGQHWLLGRSAAKALEGCAYAISDTERAERLIFLAIGYIGLDEDDPIKGENVSLLELGINMAKGDVTESLMILANNLREHDCIFPELLAPTLRRFANDTHPAIRALILRRLPYLQSKNFDLGWELFHITMRDAEGLWQMAEPCLYYALHNHFEVVIPLLTRLRNEGRGEELETWGRITALATMTSNKIAEFLADLNTLDSTAAWRGSATVWTNTQNIKHHKEQCLTGIDTGLNAGGLHAKAVAMQMDHLFNDKTVIIDVPTELIRRCFSVFKNDGENKHHRLFGFHEWLNGISQYDPEQALTVTEIYLEYISHDEQNLYDHENSLTQLMTRLFAEAEEREESDSGAMLQRVVAVQDTLLSLGVNGVVDWLKAAERP